MKAKKTKSNNLKKGFTLMETLISIAIFGIILVSMTGIVLNLIKVSILTDRRNDFLNELNNAVGNIKNEMRNAETIGICKAGATPGPNGDLYIAKKSNATVDPYLQLSVEINPSSKLGRLVWYTLTTNPATDSNPNKCTVDTTKPAKYLTSETLDISNLTFNSVNDSADIPNFLIYASFWACDVPSVVNKVFDCTAPNPSDKSPYKYMFAISTRND